MFNFVYITREDLEKQIYCLIQKIMSQTLIKLICMEKIHVIQNINF